MLALTVRFLIRILPILYMALIWFFSSYPSDAIIDTGLSFDALLKESLHLVEFGILYLLLMFSFAAQGKIGVKDHKIALFISVIYGLVDEIHQYFVPSRTATVIDFIKDVIGVAVAWYIFNYYYKRKISKKMN